MSAPATITRAASRAVSTDAAFTAREEAERKRIAAFKRGESLDLLMIDGTHVETLALGDGSTFPESGNNLRVHYTATVLGQHEAFDSSRARGEPLYFVLGTGFVLKAVEAVLLNMSFGQLVRITVKPEQAYGAHGHPPLVPPNATLVYEVELRAIQI